MKQTTEQRVELFFKERFPNKNIEFEKKCGYFWEWVDRFNTGTPENYMDGDSLKAYRKITEQTFEDNIKSILKR